MADTNLMSLFIKVGIDSKDAEAGLNDLNNDVKSKSHSIGSALGNAFKTAGKVAVAALAAAGAAVVALTKSAIEAYSQFEQLEGGIDTMFGHAGKSFEEFEAEQRALGKAGGTIRREWKLQDKAMQLVMKNSTKAYRTAGMSANQYMDNVMGMSASLINSVGGDTIKAAQLADMAILDMADNANKMGTDMESIENAYKGFAKQNYTMLDNLKLGYSGSKEGMEQLLKDAEAISGIHYDIDNYSDVVSAIHVIQGEMGITGTTSKEAASTIQGSLAMTKAAWENVLVALAGGNIDLEESIDALVESGITTLNNIFPVVLNVMDGIGTLVEKLAPVIAEKLPGIIKEILPKFLHAAVTLIVGIAKALPELFQVILDAIGDLFTAIKDWIDEENPELGKKIDGIIVFFQGVADWLVSFWNETLKPALAVIWNYIQVYVIPMFKTFGDTISTIWNDYLVPFAEYIAAGFIEAWGALKTYWNKYIVPVIQKVSDVFSALWEEILKPFGEFLAGTFSEVWDNLRTFWEETLQPKIEALGTAFNNFKNRVLIPIKNFLQQTFLAAWQKISSFFGGDMTDSTNSIGDTFKNLRDRYLYPIWNWIKKFFITGLEAIETTLSGLIDFLTNVFEGDWEGAWNTIVTTVGTLFDGLVDLLKAPINAVIDLINGMIRGVRDSINTIIEGVNDKLKIVIPRIEVSWQGFSTDFENPWWRWSPKLRKVSWPDEAIAHLATGGFLGEGQSAIVGEYRPERLSILNGHAFVQPIGGVNPGDRFGNGSTYNNTINIYQQPGESSEELADRIQRVFVRWQEQEDAVWA